MKSDIQEKKLHTFDSYSPKRVSYVLTTKNRANYLNTALQNYRTLIGPEDELIIVDGNSTDNTREIVEKYKDMIDMFVSEPETYSQEAIGKGMLLARGKYVKVITDDDIFYPEAMEQSVEIMEKNPDIDMLLCGGTKERKGKVKDYYVPAGVNFGKNTEDVFRYKGASGVGQLIRRKSLATVGTLHPVGVNVDVELVLRFIKMGAKVRFARINSYHHPVYDHSSIVVKKDLYKADTLRLVREYCGNSFYIRYFLRKHPVWSFFVDWRDKLLRRKNPDMPHLQKSGMVWDGGLS